MTSLMPKGSAVAALDTLRLIGRSLETAPSRISSGNRAETASDNAAYWSTTGTELEEMVSVVDAMHQYTIDIAAAFGALSSRISLQTDFVADLRDSIDIGVRRLVDTDMTEEATKLKALQAQQQLAIQSLSIANSNSQTILSLFQSSAHEKQGSMPPADRTGSIDQFS
ncbi:hypothetical protein HGO38_11135 [Rhizobium sp. CG5]|nr:hypothetical protein [Rhizobium sp. CG5]